MKIYMSSTYVDLAEHRAAVARVLRQMGHEVVGMEEYVAEGMRPLDRCLDDVRKSDVYVGIFAWRYGYVPKGPNEPNPGGGTGAPPAAPVTGAVTAPAQASPAVALPRQTSITESEFSAAKRPLVFLLDPKASWPAHHIDALTGENERGARISRLREELAANWLAGFFTTAEDLARQVSAAVHRREVADRIENISLTLHSEFNDALMLGGPIADSTLMSMKASLIRSPNLSAIRVDLRNGDYWWSTRLFFLAAVGEDLVGTRLVLIVEQGDRFVGAVTPATLRDRLARANEKLRTFDDGCRKTPVPSHDLGRALDQRASEWNAIFDQSESAERMLVSRRELRRWLGADLHEGSVPREMGQVSPTFLKSILEWPHPYVPVTSEEKLQLVVDRVLLAEQLAAFFVEDLGGLGRRRSENSPANAVVV